MSRFVIFLIVVLAPSLAFGQSKEMAEKERRVSQDLTQSQRETAEEIADRVYHSSGKVAEKIARMGTVKADREASLKIAAAIDAVLRSGDMDVDDLEEKFMRTVGSVVDSLTGLRREEWVFFEEYVAALIIKNNYQVERVFRGVSEGLKAKPHASAPVDGQSRDCVT